MGTISIICLYFLPKFLDKRNAFRVYWKRLTLHYTGSHYNFNYTLGKGGRFVEVEENRQSVISISDYAMKYLNKDI